MGGSKSSVQSSEKGKSARGGSITGDAPASDEGVIGDVGVPGCEQEPPKKVYKTLAKVGRISTIASRKVKEVVRSRTFQEGDVADDEQQRPR
jgi:hypothetical protein